MTDVDRPLPLASFTCLGCGRHMVSLVPEPERPSVCGACRTMPGWPRDAAVRAALDPECRMAAPSRPH